MPSLTTATTYQSRSLRDSNTRHTWMNKNGNCESSSPFITLPLVDRFWQSCSLASSHATPIHANNGKLKNISLLKIYVGKHQPKNIFNTNFFENEIFWAKVFQTTVHAYVCNSWLTEYECWLIWHEFIPPPPLPPQFATDSHQQVRTGEREGDATGPGGRPLCAAHRLPANSPHHDQHHGYTEGNVRQSL